MREHVVHVWWVAWAYTGRDLGTPPPTGSSYPRSQQLVATPDGSSRADSSAPRSRHSVLLSARRIASTPHHQPLPSPPQPRSSLTSRAAEQLPVRRLQLPPRRRNLSGRLWRRRRRRWSPRSARQSLPQQRSLSSSGWRICSPVRQTQSVRYPLRAAPGAGRSGSRQ